MTESNPVKKQRLALLGSTGSIGRQTLDIVRGWGELFEVAVLSARDDWEGLARQAVEFGPDSVVIANKEHYPALKEALAAYPVKVYAGDDAVAQVVAGGGVDVVVNAIVGYAGLQPTVRALEAGKKVALANKESLVVAGDIVMRLSVENRAPILPVDSEHSAIFQCLVGERSPVARIILTASGGPFLNTPAEELAKVTARQALAHPRWSMGRKISVDSATLINKGLEMIEAHWLFGLPGERIDVLVHPQSIVHSMVEFADGSVKAQMGEPDMRLPIRYALSFPDRLDAGGGKFDFAKNNNLTFLEPDHGRFPALKLAYAAHGRGGNSACVMNAANEVAVAAFLAGGIGFGDIVRAIEYTLEKATFVLVPTLELYRESDREAREITQSFIK